MGKASDSYDAECAGRRGRAWEGHLARLHVANYIAVCVFAVSMYSLIRAWDGALNRMNYFRLAVPSFFVFASMTYLFGFFGISIISGVMDPRDPPFAFPASPTTTTTKKRSSISKNSKENKTDGAPSSKDSASSTSTFSWDKPEVLVVGAGTAGASAAITLARQGRRVMLLEKCMREQDRIVGELLQPGGLRALERLGLDKCAKEGTDSVVVDGYAVIPSSRSANLDREAVLLHYPKSDPESTSDFFGRGVTLTSAKAAVGQENVPRGRSFHNCRFVEQLRELASAEPNVRIVESTVTALLEGKGGEVVGVRYREAQTEGAPEGQERTIREVKAPLTLVADGIWSGLRKGANTNRPQHLSSFVGVLVTHPPDEAPVPYRHCGHVVLANPSPILIYQISSTETRVLVDVAGPMPNAANGELAKFLRERSAPQLPVKFQPAFLEAVARGDVKSMPNRALQASNNQREGMMLIGDALNMRHPLTGGGMTVAIKDVELLSALLEGVSFEDKAVMASVAKRFNRERRSHAATINILANALYQVFSTPEEKGGRETRVNLQEACFDYLSLGGCFSAGPVGLLSGLTPVPWVLATHFFMVAGHGIKKHLWPVPTPGGCLRVYRLLHVATKIIMPLLEGEGSTFLVWWPVKTIVQLVLPWEHERWT